MAENSPQNDPNNKATDFSHYFEGNPAKTTEPVEPSITDQFSAAPKTVFASRGVKILLIIVAILVAIEVILLYFYRSTKPQPPPAPPGYEWASPPNQPPLLVPKK
jgi:hypothetical protein